jgi:hypothetical protein
VEDQDEWDREAIFFFASLRRSNPLTSVMVGSARLIRGREDPAFILPCQRGHRFELPGPVLAVPAVQREEVGRVVSEMPRGWGVGRLVTTLGLLQAMGQHHDRVAGDAPLRCGLATIKLRLLRGLRSIGLPLYEIPSSGVIYPIDGPMAGYFHWGLPGLRRRVVGSPPLRQLAPAPSTPPSQATGQTPGRGRNS